MNHKAKVIDGGKDVRCNMIDSCEVVIVYEKDTIYDVRRGSKAVVHLIMINFDEDVYPEECQCQCNVHPQQPHIHRKGFKDPHYYVNGVKLHRGREGVFVKCEEMTCLM